MLQARLTAAQLKLKRLHLETRAATLAKQLAVAHRPACRLHPSRSRQHSRDSRRYRGRSCRAACPASTPQVPLARSKQFQAKGDDLAWRRPQIGFGAVYNYDSNELNNYSTYFKNFTPNNFSFGLQITVPFFDFAFAPRPRNPPPKPCAPRSKPSKPSSRTTSRSPPSPATCASWTPWPRLPV